PLILLLTSACGNSGADKSVPAVPVTIAPVKRQSVPVNLISIGTVQSLRTVIVRAQVDGVIKEINFKEGDEVKAGDLLVTLDRRPFENGVSMAQADLITARAQAEQAEADAQRYKLLDEQAMVAKGTYAQ